MFNDATSEFDVLVASDAIGMGLNLNISRIIFSTLKKFDGESLRDLTISEIKQIAGRAGRFVSNYPSGEVTCMHGDDLPLLHSSLKAPSPDQEHAGMFPTYDLLHMYSKANMQNVLYRIGWLSNYLFLTLTKIPLLHFHDFICIPLLRKQ